MSTAEALSRHPRSQEASTSSHRLLSLDCFRGLLVMGMVLVTNAGSWSYVYWPLKHADWNGITPTDLIFPSFLFVCGLSMTYSFPARARRGQGRGLLLLHLVERSLLLIVLGFFLNGFPLFDMHNLRIPGILQRIGLCCLIAGGLYLFTAPVFRQSGARPPERTAPSLLWVVASIPILLIGYWMVMTLVPVPGYGAGHLDMAGNLGAYIDRSLMHTNHLWFWGGQMWDPEGLLSTLPATANVLLGILAGVLLQSSTARSRKLAWLVVGGVVLMLVGLALSPVIPINKKIWTPSFMLFSGGFSLLAFALLHWLIDGFSDGFSGDAKDGLKGWRRVLIPALVFGSNAILGFALAQMLNPLFGMIHLAGSDGKTVDVPGFFFQTFVGALGPWNASLAYAILFVMLNLLLLWPLFSRQIRIRL